MDYRERYQAWLGDPGIDEADKRELQQLEGDEAELKDRFYMDLQFGTAGLRGVIGLGANRMNRYVVGRATQGYADVLNGQKAGAEGDAPTVAIAYDSRRYSEEFALEAALVLCANGITVHLFPQMRSVPQLSFAIGNLGCDGGIVITASHNPAAYNGYKVYGANGAQIGPELAEAVTEAIGAVPDFGAVKTMGRGEALETGRLIMLEKDQDDAYFAYTKGLSLDPGLWKDAAYFPAVYTPLHGTGALAVPRLLGEMGMTRLGLVDAQMHRDPDFSTVSAPNPEQPDALGLAVRQARSQGAKLVMATDPDADRLGVAVRDGDGNFISLTGNQIGVLLFHYIVTQLEAQDRMPKEPLMVRSLVTGHMADAVAAERGVAVREVLTGFRYIGEIVDECSRSGKADFLFGFEESFGYLAGTEVRDKDAILAAMLLMECALYHDREGRSLLDALELLYGEYGYYTEGTHSYELAGIEGKAKIASAMDGLRANTPPELAGVKVLALRDYLDGYRVDADGNESDITLPKSDIVYLELAGGSWICVRPSGTEPKLKVYVNARGETRQEAQLLCEGLLLDMREELGQVLDA